MAREFLRGVENRSFRCERCSREFWPRLAGYWFVLLSPRGRCRFPGAEEMRVLLCSACGREARDLLESFGILGESVFADIRAAGLEALPGAAPGCTQVPDRTLGQSSSVLKGGDVDGTQSPGDA